MSVQACLNGARRAGSHPTLPVTPAELARDAALCRAAGAETVHLHVRDHGGAESLRPEHVAETLTAVREAVPGMPVGISTGAWIPPYGQRLAAMAEWSVRPDFVSVNLSEADAPEVIALMQRQRIGVEAGLSSLEDVRRLLPLEPGNCLRFLVEMETADFAAQRKEAEEMIRRLADAAPHVPVLLHGMNATAWRFVDMAAEQGLATRIGLEDVLTLPDGSPADNPRLVAEAVRRYPAI
ncbi:MULTISPECIES: 3-keto-5-aminohexanoate cleavage protein [unclassified Haematobacter]|uniref:3-keto-5-aminohexanoate cleavage protein n=1 Tax=unclassified Haematobacter TaxID=2640585 RepID=UPI0025BC4FAA|nr:MULTISPECIES: 3-keto-5-aminohexanoate cleavage protein [unclassified Haematobacter]